MDLKQKHTILSSILRSAKSTYRKKKEHAARLDDDKKAEEQLNTLKNT